MNLIPIDHHPSGRQLAVFAGTWLLVFAGMSVATLAKGGAASAVCGWAAAAVVAPLLGLLWPPALRIVYRASAYAALPIGLVVSCLVMAVVYYMLLTPVGLLLRLCGNDPLRRRLDRQATSYWTPRSQDVPLDRYFRQF